jgi:hypothetical protein
MRRDMTAYDDVVEIVHKDDPTLRYRIEEADFDKDGLTEHNGKPSSFKAAGFRIVAHADGTEYKPKRAAPEPKAPEPKADDKK